MADVQTLVDYLQTYADTQHAILGEHFAVCVGFGRRNPVENPDVVQHCNQAASILNASAAPFLWHVDAGTETRMRILMMAELRPNLEFEMIAR